MRGLTLLPFTCYVTHYTLVPNAGHPTGIHYGSDGHSSAKGPDREEMTS
jgi:hypothetical protein